MPKVIQQALLPFLILFHLIGFTGMVFFDLEQFSALSMYHLLFCFLLIFLAQQKGKEAFFRLFVPVFLLGYFIEVVGIKTGFPFGTYRYGDALGVMVLDVPLIIGVNWFMLVMGAGYITDRWFAKDWLKIVIASLIMVAVDYPIEQMASTLDYWHWKDDQIPAQNFIGWFVIALLMQWLFQKLMKDTENKLAPWYIIVVAVFFIMLNVFL